MNIMTKINLTQFNISLLSFGHSSNLNVSKVNRKLYHTHTYSKLHHQRNPERNNNHPVHHQENPQIKNQFNPYLINKTLEETTINLLHNQENLKERTIELYTMAKPSRKKKIRSSIWSINPAQKQQLTCYIIKKTSKKEQSSCIWWQNPRAEKNGQPVYDQEPIVQSSTRCHAPQTGHRRWSRPSEAFPSPLPPPAAALSSPPRPQLEGLPGEHLTPPTQGSSTRAWSTQEWGKNRTLSSEAKSWNRRGSSWGGERRPRRNRGTVGRGGIGKPLTGGGGLPGDQSNNSKDSWNAREKRETCCACH